MNLLGNIIWLLFGGLVTAIGYIFGGLMDDEKEFRTLAIEKRMRVIS